jgi:hypothetical protein
MRRGLGTCTCTRSCALHTILCSPRGRRVGSQGRGCIFFHSRPFPRVLTPARIPWRRAPGTARERCTPCAFTPRAGGDRANRRNSPAPPHKRRKDWNRLEPWPRHGGADPKRRRSSLQRAVYPWGLDALPGLGGACPSGGVWTFTRRNRYLSRQQESAPGVRGPPCVEDGKLDKRKAPLRWRRI